MGAGRIFVEQFNLLGLARGKASNHNSSVNERLIGPAQQIAYGLELGSRADFTNSSNITHTGN